MLVKVEEKSQRCHIKKNGGSTSLVHVQRNMDYLESSDFFVLGQSDRPELRD